MCAYAKYIQIVCVYRKCIQAQCRMHTHLRMGSTLYKKDSVINLRAVFSLY